MAELQPIIVFHGCHFVCHLEICTPICVKLFQVMSGVILCNLKKNNVSISNRFPGVHKRGIHTHIQTDRQTDRHTHDDSIRSLKITELKLWGTSMEHKFWKKGWAQLSGYKHGTQVLKETMELNLWSYTQGTQVLREIMKLKLWSYKHETQVLKEIMTLKLWGYKLGEQIPKEMMKFKLWGYKHGT